MEGINISQGRAQNLKEFDIYLDMDTGWWIATEDLCDVDYIYRVYLTGDRKETIPPCATRH